MTALPDSSAAANRRAFLAGAAAAVAAPAAFAVLGAAAPASASAAPGCPPPGYAPVPPSALGPALNADGYFVGPVTDTLYWVTDSFYQAMFLTTRDGVVLIDAPPTIGHNLLRAIEAITSANGMSSTVTHMVYSHSHADHIGASSLFGADVIRIGQAGTRRLLLRDDDPNRPPPTVTFEDRYVLEVGGELLELAYHGPNQTPDNIFIHAPAHQTLMVVDILFPGWVPFKSLAIAQDIPGWIGAQEVAMSYPWTTLVGGHLGRLGVPAADRGQAGDNQCRRRCRLPRQRRPGDRFRDGPAGPQAPQGQGTHRLGGRAGTAGHPAASGGVAAGHRDPGGSLGAVVAAVRAAVGLRPQAEGAASPLQRGHLHLRHQHGPGPDVAAPARRGVAA